MILGGGSIAEYAFSRACGVNPSAASGTVIIDNTGGGAGDFSLAVGDYIVYSFDAFASFYGIITETSERSSSPSEGLVQRFTVNDNRIRLGWQTVFGCWNMEDEIAAKHLGRPDAPSAPGNSDTGGDDSVDMGSGLDAFPTLETPSLSAPTEVGGIRRRYWSILPENWAAGIKTWHETPFSTREILNFAFNGAWGDYGFTRDYHPDLDDVVLIGLDHSNGIKLSNLLTEINGKAGLEIAIEGARELVWLRKGEGLLPVADGSCDNRSAGEALTANDTKIRVVGDKTRVQVLNMVLEPDWQAGWEPFIDELAWRREVAAVFDLPTDSAADQADLSALARKITVYQYAKQKEDPALLDYRSFGQGSRVNMSAWMYLQEIVFRSYRIPPDKKLYGIPVSSLQLADSLLCGTDIEGSGAAAKQIYARDPVEFYPKAQAQVIFKGQPLDLINSRDTRLFYRNTTGDLRNEWTVAGDFEVDPVNMSVRFSAPVFIDGLPSAGKSIYLNLNKGEGGGTDVTALVKDGSSYLDVVVPNPDYEIQPAGVKASFCFLLGPFHRDYGVGPRRGTLPMPGLCLHLLDVKDDGSFPDGSGVASFDSTDLRVPTPSEGTFREILYQDGGKAIDKAGAAASSLLALSPVQASGGFRRMGTAGTPLTGVVDRIDLTVSFDGGIAEQITFTKARATGAALAEKTLARLQRTEEIYPGQDKLKEEVRQYRVMAAAMRSSRVSATTTHKVFSDVFSKPVGGERPSTFIVKDVNEAAPDGGWMAGHCLWLDHSGVPVNDGSGYFGGVLVSKPSSAASEEGGAVATTDLMVANAGIVPVRIEGKISAGGEVWLNRDTNVAGREGDVIIGRLRHGENAPEVAEGISFLALVDLNAATGMPEGRFTVTFDQDKQRLHVGPGSIVIANSEEDHQSVKPHVPNLKNGEDPPKPISENPYWDISGVTTGVVYNVWCMVGTACTHSKMLFQKDSESVDFEFPEENAWCVAHLTFKAAESGGGLAIDGKIHQDWQDDIEWFSAKGDGSSDSSGDDDGSSAGDESSDDDESIGEESSDDDSSDDSSSDDSSEEDSDSFACPDVEIEEVLVISIDGSTGDPPCFEDNNDDGVPDGAYVNVHVVVKIGALVPGCYPYVRVFRDGPGGAAATIPLGFATGPQTVTVPLRFFAFPSSAAIIIAQIKHPASSKPGCYRYNACPNSDPFTLHLPGGC